MRPGFAIRLLGGVRAYVDGGEVALGSAGPRSLLALLALRANTPVSITEIIDAMWGEHPPSKAANGVYTYISTLRKALRPAKSTADSISQLLTSNRAGYTLRLESSSLDVAAFESAAASTRSRWAGGDVQGAMTDASDALSLWTGVPLAGVTGPFAEQYRFRLDQLHLDVIEIRCAAMIDTGSAHEAATDLSSWVAAYPLRERFAELHMLALHRTGRTAEALDVYRRSREHLVEQLGIEPGAGLRAMREVVASGTDSGHVVTTVVGGTPPVPAQLPRANAEFAGRMEEERKLRDRCLSKAPAPIVTIDGAAGMGKTSLAVRVAHQLAPHFPDGQLFVDLRGFNPSQPPLSAEEALAQLLPALGAAADMLNHDAIVKESLYRSLLATKRVLIVLDNAASAHQVRPLLPGGSGCAVIVTSRARLVGLAARDGADRIGLVELRPAESLELLRRTAKRHVVDAELEAAEELARHCGYLPLALRVVAERISGSVSDALDELRGEQSRLDMLAVPDDDTMAVRSAFSWSYHALKPDAAQAFRLLSLHPSTEFGTHDAAALLDATPVQTKARLTDLTQKHLLEPCGPDRYRFHDLLRLYARECTRRDESPGSSERAVQRLLHHWLTAVLAARACLAPAVYPIDLPALAPAPHSLTFTGYQDAVEWAGRELTTASQLVEFAIDHGHDEAAARLTAALGVLWHSTGRLTEWLRTNEIGQGAAARSGDALTAARLHIGSGGILQLHGHEDDSIPHFQAAMELLRGLDRSDPAVAGNLALAAASVGRHAGALPLLEDALTTARQIGNRLMEASVENGIAVVLSRKGQHAEAVARALLSIEIAREAGGDHVIGQLLHRTGEICLHAGQNDDAVRHLEEGRAALAATGNRWGEAHCTFKLAVASHARGDDRMADALLMDALAIIRPMPLSPALDEELETAIKNLQAELTAQ